MYFCMYIYIYTIYIDMYKLRFISSIGTGWIDNVHLSGCVCVCAIMTLMEEAGMGCI